MVIKQIFVHGLVWACALSVVAERHCVQDQPNILFVMSDDHTSQAIGVYGGRLASLNPTPTIDSLAKDGMVMDNAFCQNAICTPSRASIMTGQSSAVNGVITLFENLPKERQYLAIEMNKAGYQTAVIGKWHLKDRPEAFDYYKVLFEQGEYFDPIFAVQHQTKPVIKKHTSPRKIANKGPFTAFENAVQMKGHSSDCIADSALEWFKEKRAKDKPFFLKLHFKAPHDNFEYAPRYKTYLSDVHIPEPENLRASKKHGSIATRGHNDELVRLIGTSVGPRNQWRSFAWRAGKGSNDVIGDAYQHYLKAYLRCVKGVDDNLKRVIDYLKAEGLYENTVIIYTGDQGFYLGEHDYIDKRWPYEESMRMPFIVRYPKSVKTGRSDAIVENIDFAPTMLDFAGVKTPDYMHGRSFKPILETGNQPPDWKEAAYYHYWMHMKHHANPACIAIRTKRYKLILFYGTGWDGETKPTTPPGWELYDLQSDPTEDNNVYDNPEYAPVIVELKAQLKTRRAELGEDDPKFAFNKVIDEFWEYGAAEKDRAIEISHQYRNKTKVGK